MTRLTDIVQINITRETAAVAQTNFNIPLFLAAHVVWPERAREYTSLEEVATDFPAGSSVLTAATKLFGQEISPARIVVGRRHIPSATVSVDNAVVGGVYTLRISDLVYTRTAVAEDTQETIAAALKTMFDESPVEGVTVTDNLDGTLTVASSDAYSVNVTGDLTVTTTAPTEAWVDTLAAVEAENNAWYALTTEDHTPATVLALASAIEGRKKIYGISTSAVDVARGQDGNLFQQLQDLGYQRTFGIFSATADTEYPECAWIGFQLQERPGSNTWAYKTLSDVTVSRMSSTEASAIKNANGNTYEYVGGNNVTIGGKMFGGEWIDVIVFVDWLEARMSERLWFRLKNSKKIPYTQAGATILETEIRAQLQEGIRVGGLADSPAPTVSVPDVNSLSPNLRANRQFDGLEFEARLAGAIHFVSVRGRVTV